MIYFSFLSREYLYSIRPKTVKPSIEKEDDTSQSYQYRGRYSGCPACSGNPIKRNQVIPEPRIPFPPVKKTINKKLLDEPKVRHKCCRYCC